MDINERQSAFFASGDDQEKILPPDPEIKWTLDTLLDQGTLTPSLYRTGLSSFGVLPSPGGWGLFIHRLGLLLGVLLCLAGVIFFIAWNWVDLPRGVKLALGQALFLLLGFCGLRYWEKPAGQAALAGLAIGIGALLALYGQIYQTGADAYELFTAWTIALIPLAIAGRQAALYFILWLVGNTAYILYCQQTYGYNYERLMFFQLALIQTGSLLLWEAASTLADRHSRLSAHHGWLEARWLPRIIAASLIALLTGLTGIGDGLMDLLQRLAIFPEGIVYCLTLALFFGVYGKLRRDLFMLSLTLLSPAALFGISIAVNLVDELELEGLLLGGLWIGFLCFAFIRALLFFQKRFHLTAEPHITATPVEQPETAQGAGPLEAQTRQSEPAGELKPSGIKPLPRRQKEEPGLARVMQWLKTTGTLAEDNTDKLQSDLYAKAHAEAPWYARLFTMLGALLCVLLLSAFFFLQFLIDNHPSGGVTLGYGLIVCLGGLAAIRASGLFLRYLGSGAVVCGTAFILGGLFMLFDEELSLYHIAILFIALSVALPSFWPRAAASFFAVNALRQIPVYGHINPNRLLDTIFGWRNVYQDVQPYSWLSMPGLFYGLLAGGCLWLFMHKHLFAHKKWAYLLMPVIFAIIFDLLCMAGLLLAISHGVTEFFGLNLPYLVSPFVGVTFFAVLLAIQPLMFKTTGIAGQNSAPESPLKQKLPQMGILLGGGLVLSACAWFAPGIALGLIILLLARGLGSGLGLGCAALYFALYLNSYYYFLEINLLYKSLLLMGSGLAALACALVARQAAAGAWPPAVPDKESASAKEAAHV